MCIASLSRFLFFNFHAFFELTTILLRSADMINTIAKKKKKEHTSFILSNLKPRYFPSANAFLKMASKLLLLLFCGSWKPERDALGHFLVEFDNLYLFVLFYVRITLLMSNRNFALAD